MSCLRPSPPITDPNSQTFPSLNSPAGLACIMLAPTRPVTRGEVERHNRMIRRYIPKGMWMKTVNNRDIARIQGWMNRLPRRILDYKKPVELFNQELSRLDINQTGKYSIQNFNLRSFVKSVLRNMRRNLLIDFARRR